MRVCACECTRACVQVLIRMSYVCMFVLSLCAYVYVCMYACACTCAPARANACMRMYVIICACMYPRMCAACIVRHIIQIIQHAL